MSGPSLEPMRCCKLTKVDSIDSSAVQPPHDELLYVSYAVVRSVIGGLLLAAGASSKLQAGYALAVCLHWPISTCGVHWQVSALNAAS